MNKARRGKLDEAINLLGQARDIITTVAEEEREAFDNLSEDLQASSRGQRLEEIANSLEEQILVIEDAENEIGILKE